MAPTFIGYSIMMGDNSGNAPVPGFTGTASSVSGGNPSVALNPFNGTTDKDKKFRINLFVNTLNNALTIGVYTDWINYGANLYNHYTNFVPDNSTSTHHQQTVQTVKAYAAYNVKAFGIGVEWFSQSMTNGEIETWAAGQGTTDTTSAMQTGMSIFAHATIITDKLNIFARYDMFKADADYSYNVNESFATKMSNVSSVSNTYNGAVTSVPGNTYSESFINAGLDWTPTKDKKVHFMPNIWYYGISNGFGGDNLKSDNYMVYRLTFHYIFK